MFRINSPRSVRRGESLVSGDIASSVESVNIHQIAENNQRKYPEKIVVSYLSNEISSKTLGREFYSSIKVNNQQILYFNHIKDVIDYILVHDIYPFQDKPIFEPENLDIVFYHQIIDREIFSNYMFFSPVYYQQVKNILQQLRD